jgi:hypothetical protein
MTAKIYNGNVLESQYLIRNFFFKRCFVSYKERKYFPLLQYICKNSINGFLNECRIGWASLSIIP